MSEHPASPLRHVLLVTPCIESNLVGGRELLSRLHRDVLADIYGARLVLLELPRRPIRGFGALLGAVRGHIDGLDSAVIERMIVTVGDGADWYVFLDGSNLGAVARSIRRACPLVRIVTFFHNCEVRFFLGAFRQSKSLRALAVLVANYRAERLSVRYSDELLCLTQRDSLLIKKIYGHAATHILPMAMQDKAAGTAARQSCEPVEPMMLFAGGTFYANRAGIAWFVKNVVPHVTIPLCIVGRGFENYREALEVPGKVSVVGAVEDMSQWYTKASFVIAPIFDGSGMKTKVAEALMYGKRVIGTAEAFSGYEDIQQDIGWICNSSSEFVTAIRAATDLSLDGCDPGLRKIYLEKYSLAAARDRLRMIMQ